MMNEGLYLVNKPAGWTSFDVVAKMRKLTGIKSIGHAGTLDPFATGLLILLIGKKFTKKQDSFMKLDKVYEAELELGKTSTTGDPEGVIAQIPNSKFQIPKRGEIENVLEKFRGEIEQVPPQYSAIKVGGVRAYEAARKGKSIELKPRKVRIDELRITSYDFPILKLHIHCSSGTYIRSLSADIGEELGVGAYLTNLRRTKIGPYELKDAKTIQELSNME